MTNEPEQLDLVIAVNRKSLIDFFDQGAPHFEFDMTRGLVIKTYHEEELPTTCGTAGCIAGVAFAMWLRTLEPTERAEILRPSRIANPHDSDEPLETEFDYSFIRDGALKFLGLEWTKHEGIMQFGHPLFSYTLAPRYCTPADAADALRRTFDGQDPWPQD